MQTNVAYVDLLKKCLTASIYDESAWTLVEGPMVHERGMAAWLKRKIINIMQANGFLMVRPKILDANLRAQGIDWPLFGMTMVGIKRLDNIQYCVETILSENVPGDFVETGVWRGGSSIFAKALLREYGDTERNVWCCDSFEGMPVSSAKDLDIDPRSDYSDRDFLVASQEVVANNFRKFGLLDERVKFLKGWFCDTLPTAPIAKIAILRMDGDLYDSTMDALKNLYSKVSVGGFVIIDDYKSWSGCRKAIDEFRSSHKIEDPIIDIDAHAVYWRRTVPP